MTGKQRKKARGRRKGAGGASHDAILDAARALFARHGFRGTTMRTVARSAGVDQALVNYFFDSKAKLFSAAIALHESHDSLREVLLRAPRRGEAILRFHLQNLFSEKRDSIAAMLRAAVADPDCIPTLRAFVEETMVSDVADVLGGKDARLRAEIAGAFMVGLFVVRHMVGVEPLAQTTDEGIIEIAAPALNVLLRSGAARQKKSTAR